MRHLPPDDEDTDDLPFTLPPGPYSTTKPDYSYAAMIGQAIISSPEHRLPLQDIYEYITTVYPYYKRGEQTWMNSVRHALSTMAVFRKVPRGKMEGKSLWAILDCDLPCFAHGGFRKSLCADMMKQKAEAAAKSGPKKRGTMDETIARNAKRRKKSTNSNHTSEGQVHHYNSSAITTQVHTFPPMFAAGPAIGVGPPVLPPFYAAVLPGSHHQPYYPAYVPQPVPAEVIFPPLPASSGYHRIANFAATQQQHASVARASSVDEPSSESALPPSSDSGLFESDDHEGDDGSVKGKGKGKGKSKEVTPPPDSDSPTAPTSSSSGAPGLTPNGSSDSSPTMSSEASAVGAEVPSDAESFVGAPRVVGVEDDEFEEWLKEDPGVDDGGEGGGYRLLKEVSAKKEKEKLSGSVRRLPTKVRLSVVFHFIFISLYICG